MTKTIMRWFRRKPRNFFDERDIPSLTMEEFASSEPLVTGLRRVMGNQAFQVALRTIEDARPIGHPQPGIQPMDYAYHYGLSLGYSLALDNLRTLAKIVESKPIEATFAHNPDMPDQPDSQIR